jgi:uncharacterized protein (TIGR02265 family)
MQQVKGSVLKTRMAFVEEEFGPGAGERVLASLSEEDRRALHMLYTIRWYPFDLVTRLDDAIVAVLGKGDTALFERLGAASAEKNLATLHKNLLAPGDPHAFLQKAETIYALYYESGRREYERTGEAAGAITTHGAATFSRTDCQTVVGWYRRALELCGTTNVRVTESSCRAKGAEVCRYEFAWG